MLFVLKSAKSRRDLVNRSEIFLRYDIGHKLVSISTFKGLVYQVLSISVMVYRYRHEIFATRFYKSRCDFGVNFDQNVIRVGSRGMSPWIATLLRKSRHDSCLVPIESNFSQNESFVACLSRLHIKFERVKFFIMYFTVKKILVVTDVVKKRFQKRIWEILMTFLIQSIVFYILLTKANLYLFQQQYSYVILFYQNHKLFMIK